MKFILHFVLKLRRDDDDPVSWWSDSFFNRLDGVQCERCWLDSFSTNMCTNYCNFVCVFASLIFCLFYFSSFVKSEPPSSQSCGRSRHCHRHECNVYLTNNCQLTFSVIISVPFVRSYLKSEEVFLWFLLSLKGVLQVMSTLATDFSLLVMILVNCWTEQWTDRWTNGRTDDRVVFVLCCNNNCRLV